MFAPKKIKNVIAKGLLLAFGFSSNASAGLYGFNSTNPFTEQEKILKMDAPPSHIVNYRKKMRQNIEMISNFGKEQNKDFVVLVHEDEDVLGKSLWEESLDGYNRAFKKKVGASDPAFLQKAQPKIKYTKAVNGIIKNNLLCGDGKISQNLENSNLAIFSIDYCKDGNAFDNAIEQSLEEGVVFYGFIKKNTAFKKIEKQPIINENAKNIYKLGDAKNISILIDDSFYDDKQKFIKDIADSNYDIVIINPLFHDRDPFTSDEVNRLKFKKNGAKRLILAEQNTSETSPKDYYWKMKKWKIGSPSWLKRKSFVNNDSIITEYWNEAWKNILSYHAKSIIDSGYDGVFLTGLHNHLYFEKLTPLD